MQPSCSLIYHKSILLHRLFVLKYSTKSASRKLFEDAAREEAEAAPGSTSSSARVVELHENWDGDERIQDTVLRMLVDKYKPLRTGSIQSAEQKMKLSPRQQLGSIPLTVIDTFPTTPHISLKPSGGSWATESLLPSSEDHRPWHTTFKVPSHQVSSVKLANLPPPIPSTRTSPQFSVDEHERKKEREAFKRSQQAGRLTQARESTLDYKLGVKDARANAPRTNPVGLKGWTSLVEDKIEVNLFLIGLFVL
jgi:DnaJ family protein C protein 28